MRYISVNEFSTFRVHDSEVVSLNVGNDAVVCELESIDVAMANSLNDQPTDMQAEPVRVTIEGFKVEKLAHCGLETWEDGKPVTLPPGSFAPEEYGDCLKSLQEDIGLHNLFLYSGEALEPDGKRLRAFIDLGFQNVTFSYERLTVEWECFAKKAWYVDFNKQHGDSQEMG